MNGAADPGFYTISAIPCCRALYDELSATRGECEEGREMNNIVRMPKCVSYWLLVRDGHNGIEVLTTGLPDGRQALPVFSFEEEAEMFLCLRGSRDGWRPRETSPGELLSMFHTLLTGVECVTLDPIPESPRLDTLGLLSTGREEFMGRLERRSGRGREAERRRPSLVASDDNWPAQRAD